METEKIVFEIDMSSYLQQLGESQKQIAVLQKSQAEYRKAAAAGDVEAAKMLEQINLKLKVQEDAYNSLQRVALTYGTAQKQQINTGNALANSIQTNRALLAELTAAYNAARNPGAELGKQIAEVTAALAQQEAEFQQSTAQAFSFKKTIQDSLAGVTVFGVNVGSISKGLGAAKAAFTAAGAGVRGFAAALATTGLPLVIGLFNKIISVLGTFKPVADLVESSTRAVANTFKALSLGGNIEKVTKAINDNADAMRRLNESQRTFDLSMQETRNEIAKNLAIANDQTKADEQRLKALTYAANAENAIMDGRIKRVDTFLESQEKVFKQMAQLTEKEMVQLKYGTDEQKEAVRKRLTLRDVELEAIQKYEDALIDKARLEGEQFDLSQAQAEREKKLTRELQDVKTTQTSNYKQNLAEQKNSEQQTGEEIAALKEEFLSTEEDRLVKYYDDKLALLKGKEQEESELYFTILQERQLAIDSFKQKQQETQMMAGFNSREKEKEEHAAAMETLRNNHAMQLELQQTFNQTQDDIDAEFAASGYETFAEYYEQKKQLYANDAEAKKAAEEEKRQAEQATLQATGAIADSTIDLVKNVAEAQGAGAEFSKALAFVQILIKQAIAIATAVAGATESGSATGPGAIGTIPAFIATLVGTVTSVIGSAMGMLKKPVPKSKFATGIIGLQGPGTETSDSIPAYLSKGESVITARATRRFAPVLAQMEMAVGNVPNYNYTGGHFANGVIGDGGFYVRESVNKALNSATLREAIAQGFREAPQPVVSVQEITRINNNVNRSVKVSEL